MTIMISMMTGSTKIMSKNVPVAIKRAFYFHPDHDQVDQEDRDFFILTFLPAIRSVEQISLLCSLLIVLADSWGGQSTYYRISQNMPISTANIIFALHPWYRKVSSSHYLGLRDRLQLWSNTLATVAKLGYAFIWQVSILLHPSIIIFMVIIIMMAITTIS